MYGDVCGVGDAFYLQFDLDQETVQYPDERSEQFIGADDTAALHSANILAVEWQKSQGGTSTIIMIKPQWQSLLYDCRSYHDYYNQLMIVMMNA